MRATGRLEYFIMVLVLLSIFGVPCPAHEHYSTHPLVRANHKKVKDFLKFLRYLHQKQELSGDSGTQFGKPSFPCMNFILFSSSKQLRFQ